MTLLSAYSLQESKDKCLMNLWIWNHIVLIDNTFLIVYHDLVSLYIDPWCIIVFFFIISCHVLGAIVCLSLRNYLTFLWENSVFYNDTLNVIIVCSHKKHVQTHIFTDF